jgi:CxxC motif-containing protein
MKELLCIVCPNSCRLQVEETAGGITVRGNQCRRGISFAEAEITNPVRTLTTTVRTAFPGVPAVPVRTDGEIPKGKVMEVMAYLNSITITEPLGLGAAAVENVLGLGRNVIITSAILEEEGPAWGSR